MTISENEMKDKIETASENNTFKELAEIINICKLEFNKSEIVLVAMSEWLKENNSIYSSKSFNEVLQFRAYLIYSFSFFLKNENVLKYLIYELNYSDNINIKGASIYTAKVYNDETLSLLIEPYTDDNYDVKVNFKDFEIGYKYKPNSTIQNEAIASLKVINDLSKNIAESDTHSCCSIKKNEDGKDRIDLIEKKSRKKVTLNINFFDQENSKINFTDFKGNPFLVTFFYSSCTNQNKCASSVAKLKEFQEKIESLKKIGIYVITYDPYIDKPDVLKKYGEAYGFMFSTTSKFLLPASESEYISMNSFFNTSVNYGNGVVNQHGTQLYVVDKKGKIAFKFENEVWRAEDLIAIFNKLEAE